MLAGGAAVNSKKNTIKAAATAAILFASASVGVGSQLPPIDAERPDKLETATFALG